MCLKKLNFFNPIGLNNYNNKQSISTMSKQLSEKEQIALAIAISEREAKETAERIKREKDAVRQKAIKSKPLSEKEQIALAMAISQQEAEEAERTKRKKDVVFQQWRRENTSHLSEELCHQNSININTEMPSSEEQEELECKTAILFSRMDFNEREGLGGFADPTDYDKNETKCSSGGSIFSKTYMEKTSDEKEQDAMRQNMFIVRILEDGSLTEVEKSNKINKYLGFSA